MFNKVVKSVKVMSIFALSMMMISCSGREGCPANQFSLNDDVFDVLASLLNILF